MIIGQFTDLKAYFTFLHLSISQISLSTSASSSSLSPILILLLTFISGLFIGLAVKKGVTAFILAFIGLLIAGYVGLTFVPKVSLAYEVHKWSSFLMSYLSTTKFGALQLGLSLILFLIGLAIGLWKG